MQFQYKYGYGKKTKAINIVIKEPGELDSLNSFDYHGYVNNKI